MIAGLQRLQIKTVLALVLVTAITALLLYQVDLRRIGVALLEVHVGLLFLGLALQLTILWLKSTKWRITLAAAAGRSVRRAFSASMIGFAGNLVLPARLGELARVTVIKKHNGIGAPLALTSLAVTQLFDLLVLVLYCMLISTWATSLLALHRGKVALLGGIALAALLALTMLVQKHNRIRLMAHTLFRRLPRSLAARLNGYLALFIDGLGVLRKSQLVGQVVLLTLASWVVETCATYALLEAFGIDATVLMSAVLVVVLNLGFAFPITPGNIGVTQGLCVLVLGTFGVDQALAWAYAIGAQGAAYLLILGIGLLFLYHEGIDVSQRTLAGAMAGAKPQPVEAS